MAHMFTVKDLDQYAFEKTCRKWLKVGYKIQSSGCDNGRWWAVLSL